MNPEFFGLISGGLVAISVIPYSVRTWQRKIHPNITTWSLWALIGIAILFSYKSSGADANIWPAICGFINPCLVTILATVRKNKWEKLNSIEWICLMVGLASLVMWVNMRQNKELVQYALYVGVFADACAAIPTIVLAWLHPNCDRPFAWFIFAVGYGLGIFAIPEHTPANYVLPIYFSLGSMSIALPLALHRIKTKAPWREWI